MYNLTPLKLQENSIMDDIASFPTIEESQLIYDTLVSELLQEIKGPSNQTTDDTKNNGPIIDEDSTSESNTTDEDAGNLGTESNQFNIDDITLREMFLDSEKPGQENSETLDDRIGEVLSINDITDSNKAHSSPWMTSCSNQDNSNRNPFSIFDDAHTDSDSDSFHVLFHVEMGHETNLNNGPSSSPVSERQKEPTKNLATFHSQLLTSSENIDRWSQWTIRTQVNRYCANEPKNRIRTWRLTGWEEFHSNGRDMGAINEEKVPKARPVGRMTYSAAVQQKI